MCAPQKKIATGNNIVDSNILSMVIIPSMKYVMREHCKVVRVDEMHAYLDVKIPLWLLDTLPVLLDHLEHTCRWIKTQSRWRTAEMINEARKAAVLAKIA